MRIFQARRNVHRLRPSQNRLKKPSLGKFKSHTLCVCVCVRLYVHLHVCAFVCVCVCVCVRFNAQKARGARLVSIEAQRHVSAVSAMHFLIKRHTAKREDFSSLCARARVCVCLSVCVSIVCSFPLILFFLSSELEEGREEWKLISRK